jgi:hypothetical protein
MADRETIFFNYYFIFGDGNKETFKIVLDKKTLKYIPDKKEKSSPWTKLEHHQCSNCPLKKEKSPECPLAINLSSAIPQFSERRSFDHVHVMVETAERTYSKDTTVQNALSAMMGIFMVTSDCPVMASLKPMVRFHLPFATVEETMFRAVTTYLLKQYYKFVNGEETDWNLKGLHTSYEKIQTVNRGMAQRMRSVVDKDANLNALVVLDVFAKELPFSIEKSLRELEYLFEDDGKVDLLDKK